MSNNRQGYYLHEMEAHFQERMRAQAMTARCALCTWTAEGTAGDVLELAREHRQREHGLTRSRARRASRHLNSFRSPNLTDEDWQEIDSEIARRKRLIGIEA